MKKIKKKTKVKYVEPLVDMVWYTGYTEEQLNEVRASAGAGNISSKLDLIIHNQAVLATRIRRIKNKR